MYIFITIYLELGQIRLQRKQTIVKIQNYVKIVEYLIKRCKRIQSRFIVRCEKYCNATINDTASLTPSSSNDNINMNNNTNKSTATMDSTLPIVQRYAHLNLPEYQPKFTQQIDEHGNYIITSRDLSGVLQSDIDISHRGRIVTVQGVKLKPSSNQLSNTQSNGAMQFLSGLNPFNRQHNNTVNSQQLNTNTYGIFQSRQVLPATADLQSMTWKLSVDGTLVIFIPRSLEMYKPKQSATSDANTSDSSTSNTNNNSNKKSNTPPRRHPVHKASHHNTVNAQKGNKR